jgi:hypothetical protein
MFRTDWLPLCQRCSPLIEKGGTPRYQTWMLFDRPLPRRLMSFRRAITARVLRPDVLRTVAIVMTEVPWFARLDRLTTPRTQHTACRNAAYQACAAATMVAVVVPRTV